jgi:hypothetical protein
MALGLLCCLLGVLWQLRRAGTALIACVCPPAGSDQDASSGDAVRRLDWGGPVEWFDMALRLLAVRPLVLPLLCAGVVFLSMAAYSDNFTIYVSHPIGACSAYRCVVSDSVRCTGAGYSVLPDASVPRSTGDPGKQHCASLGHRAECTEGCVDNVTGVGLRGPHRKARLTERSAAGTGSGAHGHHCCAMAAAGTTASTSGNL